MNDLVKNQVKRCFIVTGVLLLNTGMKRSDPSIQLPPVRLTPTACSLVIPAILYSGCWLSH